MSESKASKIFWIIRVIFAILILASMATWFMKPNTMDPFELMGAIGGRILIAYLLIRRWGKKESKEN
jgi:hypothetical protein